jgi:hypothetical protein
MDVRQKARRSTRQSMEHSSMGGGGGWGGSTFGCFEGASRPSSVAFVDAFFGGESLNKAREGRVGGGQCNGAFFRY